LFQSVACALKDGNPPLDKRIPAKHLMFECRNSLVADKRWTLDETLERHPWKAPIGVIGGFEDDNSVGFCVIADPIYDRSILGLERLLKRQLRRYQQIVACRGNANHGQAEKHGQHQRDDWSPALGNAD